jgi:uncharacterized membrane protein
MSEELDRLWNDEDNWSGSMYRCDQDPRVVVRGHGTTLITYNFAHPLAAWGILLGSVAASVAAIFVPMALGAGLRFATFGPLGVIALVIGLHAWILSRNE